MANLGRVVDLGLTDEEKLDAVMPMPTAMPPNIPMAAGFASAAPELDKLDIEEMPDVGDIIDLRAFARVTCVSDSGGGNRRVELQIEQVFDFEDENTEDMDGGE